MFHTDLDLSDDTIRKIILSKLPAYKNQLDASNNQKLLRIIAGLYIDGKSNLLNLNKLLSINSATGQNLTDWGKDYGIDRFDGDDNFLRFEIKWQILKANTSMTMDDTKAMISTLLNVPMRTFDIVLTDNPHEIEIVNLPFDFAGGDHPEQKRQILIDDLQDVLPSETKLRDIQFSKQSYGSIFYTIFGTQSISNESEVLNVGNI